VARDSFTDAAAAAASASGLEASANLKRVPAAAVCVLVDPLDGTKEFVDGRLQSVQTLIGISVYGRAVAGVMGLPFYGDWQDVFSPVQVSSLPFHYIPCVSQRGSLEPQQAATLL
jgi:3'-phosphoadenosine 5'-phosphosulfate (PAPS) 3'-phosphatase